MIMYAFGLSFCLMKNNGLMNFGLYDHYINKHVSEIILDYSYTPNIMKLHITQDINIIDKLQKHSQDILSVGKRNDSEHVQEPISKKKKPNSFPLDTIKNSIPVNQILEKINKQPKKDTNIFSHAPEHISMLNIHHSLCASLDKINMSRPTGIQTQAIQTMLSYMPETIQQSKPFTMYDYHEFLKHSLPLISDWMIRAPTGSGKSLAYLLPIIHTLACLCQSTSNNQSKDYFSDNIRNEPLDNHHNMNRSSGTFAIIITPTRELAIQLCELSTKLLNFPRNDKSGNVIKGPRWITPGAFLSGISRDKEKARLRTGVNLVFTTPGRLLDHLENTKSWSLRNLSWIVLEEADRFQELHFAECLSKCWKLINERTFSQRSWQLILVSATLSYNILSEGETFASIKMRNPQIIDPLPDSPLSNSMDITIPTQITQYLLQVPVKMRHLALISIIKHWKTFQLDNTGSRMLIFFTSCETVDYFFKLLAFINGNTIDTSGNIACNTSLNIILYRFHGKLDAVQRGDIMKQYCGKGDEGTLKIFLSTNLSSRGLDFPKISLIVQYDLPFDSVDYVHKIGRTARMESLGTCILFSLPHERQVILEIIGKKLEESKCPLEIQELDLVKVLSGHSSPLSKETDDKVEVGTIPENLRKELLIAQNDIEEHVKSSLSQIARDAFLASVKAYASYPKDLKYSGIHQRALHLGHYARSFGLRDPPSKLAKDSIDNIREPINKMMLEKMPKSSSVSEFDCGPIHLLKKKTIAS